MDSRIEPLPMLGLAPGDAKILRNAGARVTDAAVCPAPGRRLVGAALAEVRRAADRDARAVDARYDPAAWSPSRTYAHVSGRWP